MVDAQKIRDTLDSYFDVKRALVSVDSQGRINIHQDPSFTNTPYIECRRPTNGQLPVAFGIVEGDFDVSNCNIKTFRGFPRIIQGSLYTEENKNLRQFYDFEIEQIGGTWYHTYRQSQGLLKMLIAKKIRLYAGEDRSGVPADQVSDILNKYCGTGNPAEILRCASELNEHGFEANAEW